MRTLDYAGLKAKHRNIREGFPVALSLRVHRALSWLQRAEQEESDLDARFIFLWIGFNAAYAREIHAAELSGERSVFQEFFTQLNQLDHDGRVYGIIWQRFPAEIRLLLENRYIFQPFWNYHNAVPGYADWEDRFERNKARVGRALGRQETDVILSILFDRLYVLRNQLVHGGATWNGSVNREQVRDGSRLLDTLLPLFIDLMMDNPEVDWGEPHYPVVS